MEKSRKEMAELAKQKAGPSKRIRVGRRLTVKRIGK